jgi:hypothetical protein
MYPIIMVCKSHVKAERYKDNCNIELIKNIPRDNVFTNVDFCQGLDRDLIVVVLGSIDYKFYTMLRARFEPSHIIELEED